MRLDLLWRFFVTKDVNILFSMTAGSWQVGFVDCGDDWLRVKPWESVGLEVDFIFEGGYGLFHLAQIEPDHKGVIQEFEAEGIGTLEREILENVCEGDSVLGRGDGENIGLIGCVFILGDVVEDKGHLFFIHEGGVW